MRLRTASHEGRPDTGYSAPDRKNMGMTIICMTPMNDCICLMRAATMIPNAVMAKASSSCRPKMPRISTGS